MRDEEIRGSVILALKSDEALEASLITVTVEEGIVTTGYLAHVAAFPAQREAAGRVAESLTSPQAAVGVSGPLTL